MGGFIRLQRFRRAYCCKKVLLENRSRLLRDIQTCSCITAAEFSQVLLTYRVGNYAAGGQVFAEGCGSILVFVEVNQPALAGA